MFTKATVIKKSTHAKTCVDNEIDGNNMWISYWLSDNFLTTATVYYINLNKERKQ
jgi:hypothetical protein